MCRKIYLCLFFSAALSTTYAEKTEVDITGVSAFLAANQSVIVSRTEGGFLIGDSIDNNFSTFSFMTQSSTVGKTIAPRKVTKNYPTVSARATVSLRGATTPTGGGLITI